MSISRDDWMAAVREAAQSPLPESDAVSIRELADLLGVDKSTADRHVKRLLHVGKAERTTKLTRTAIGTIMRVTAYRLLREVPDAKRREHAGRVRRGRSRA